MAIDLALLEGLVVALSPFAPVGRLRRCHIVNGNRSRSLRGSGGCFVAVCPGWSAAALSYCKWQ